MPINGLSVGKDITIVWTDNNETKRFGTITRWNAKPVTKDDKIVAVDGTITHLIFHQGWVLEFEVERTDNSVDEYWAQAEENYFKGKEMAPATIFETIQEPGGGMSQYRYEGVIPMVEDMGDRKGDASIKIKMRGLAARRKKVV